MLPYSLSTTLNGMSVHQKLMQARIALQGKELKKSGKNKFAGYNYFELGDFLPIVQEIFLNLKLAGIVSYGSDTASLVIVDCENSEDTILITSPMSSAALKGAHEIQNLGAVQTYLRRYLWVTAMEIVEHDALDAVLGSDDESVGGRGRTSTRRPPAAAPAASPERSSSASSSESAGERLKNKLMNLGITSYGIKTVLAITESDSIEEIPENKAVALFKAITEQHIKSFNEGKNSKGTQIIDPPAKDTLSARNSIDELSSAAEEAFGDD